MAAKRKHHPETSYQIVRQFVIDTVLMLPGIVLWLAELAVGVVLVIALTIFVLVILPQLTGILLHA